MEAAIALQAKKYLIKGFFQKKSTPPGKRDSSDKALLLSTN